MVKIDTAGFVHKIEEYNVNPDRPEDWFHPSGTLMLNDGSVESTLCIPVERHSMYEGHNLSFVEAHGIRFGYTTVLVMQLIDRAYNGLADRCNIRKYGEAVAEAMQNFARPFPDEQSELCYPHFLLHGLVQPTLEEVIDKIDSNGRIIHETLEVGRKLMDEYGQVNLDGNLRLLMSSGCTDDYFGIAHLLAKQDAILVSSASSYITKASFFVDMTNKDIYVMTLQGRRFGPHDPVRAAHPSSQEKRFEAEREYSRIGNVLGMGPRRFILTKVMDFGRDKGFKRIRVIKPEEHPMFIERHEGFFGNYEPVIRKVGITEENDCYFECRL